MANVIADVTEGSIRRDMNGWSATRIFDIEDPGGSNIAKPYTAIQAIGSSHGIVYGAAHPVIPGIRVSSMSVEHVDRDPDVYRITVEYSGDAEGSSPSLIGSGIKGIEVNSGTATAEVNRDINGNLMLVTYDGPLFILSTDTLTDSIVRNNVRALSVAVAQVEIPTVTVIVTVEKPMPSHVASITLGSTVNNAPWSGLRSHKWLLLGIDSQLNDTGSYDWRYVLAVAPTTPASDSWRFVGEVKSPFNDRVITGATPGNGIQVFDVYRTMNFSQQLGFELPHG